MNLLPCLGLQKISNASTVQLRNEDSDSCKLLLRTGEEILVPGKSHIELPIRRALFEKNTLAITVKRENRIPFTIYGMLENVDKGSNLLFNDENKMNDHNTGAKSLKIETKKPIPSEDLFVLTLEKLINDRLGGEDDEREAKPGGLALPKTPHAELSKIRKQATLSLRVLDIRKSISAVISKISEKLKDGSISLKKELVLDVGFKQRVLDLFFETYDLAWLELAIPAIISQESSRNQSVSLRGLKTLFLEEIFSNQGIVDHQRDQKQGPFPENREYISKMSRYITEKIFELILFLDRAKESNVLGKKRLFKSSQALKSSERVLLEISNILADLDIPNQLKKLDYLLVCKQTPLEDYDAKLDGNLFQKVKDGVILGLLIKSYLPSCDLLSRLKIPATEPLHRSINNQKLLELVQELDPTLLETGRGKIAKEDFENLKNEKTRKEKVSVFIWKVLLKYGLESLLNPTALSLEIRYLSYRFRDLSIWRETIESVAHESNQSNFTELEIPISSQLLLQWVQVVCAKFGRQIHDLSSSLVDGSAFSCLIYEYHPELIDFTKIYFNSIDLSQISRQKQEEKVLKECLNRIRINFKLINDAMEALGDCPLRFSYFDWDNLPPKQLLFACLVFLVSRLLGNSNETRAAKKIQSAWISRRHTKTPKLLQQKPSSAEEVPMFPLTKSTIPNFTPSSKVTLPTIKVFEPSSKVKPDISLQPRDFNMEKSVMKAHEEMEERLRELHVYQASTEQKLSEASQKLEQSKKKCEEFQEKVAELERQKSNIELSAVREKKIREDLEKKLIVERHQREKLEKDLGYVKDQTESNLRMKAEAEQLKLLALQNENSELIAKMKEVGKKNDLLSRELLEKERTLENQITSLQGRSVVTQEACISLERQLMEERSLMETVQHQKSTLETKVFRLTEEIQALKTNYEFVVLENEQFRTNAQFQNEFLKERQNLLQEREKLLHEIDALERQQLALQTRQVELSETASLELEGFRTKLDEVKNLIEIEEERLSLLRANIKEYGLKRSSIEHEVQLLQQTLDKLEDERKAKENDFNSREENLHKLKDEILLERTRQENESLRLSEEKDILAQERAQISNQSEIYTRDMKDLRERTRQLEEREANFQENLVIWKRSLKTRRSIVEEKQGELEQLQARLRCPQAFPEMESLYRNDSSVHQLFSHREVLKQILIVLSSCKREHGNELCALLRITKELFEENHFSSNNLLVQFLWALMDILQTFYDQGTVFRLALEVFQVVWPRSVESPIRQHFQQRIKTLEDAFLVELKTRKMLLSCHQIPRKFLSTIGMRSSFNSIVKEVDKFKELNLQSQQNLWQEYVSTGEGMSGRTLDKIDWIKIQERAKAAPLFILPVKRSPESYFLLFSQYQDEFVLLTFLEEYRKRGSTADPWCSIRFYDDLPTTVLVQSKFSEYLTKLESENLTNFWIDSYLKSEFYEEFVWGFNFKPQHFNFSKAFPELPI